MSYELTEQSQHEGKPVELFRYHGTYQDFYYTSGQKPVSFQAPDEASPNTYIPLAMRRSAVSDTTSDDDNAEVTIDLPVATDLVAIYGFQIAPPRLELTIFRGHNPGEYIQYWNGEVENISVVKGTATIRVPSKLASALSADFPNVYFQGPCNHTLFDPRCKVLLEDWSATVVIDAIANKDITVDDIGTLDGQLIGGDAILPSGERRMIVNQVANVISLNYPFAGAEVGDDLILAAGCDLSHAGDCKTKFDNVINFGGFPFIPPDNIFNTGLEPAKALPDNTCLPAASAVFDGWYWRFWVEWEVGGLSDNAKPGLFFFNVEGVSFDIATSLDDYHQLYESTVTGSSYATPPDDPSGMYLHVVNQTSFGLSGVCKIYYQHWTWDARVLLVSDVLEPGSDAIDPDGTIDIIGVFPRHWDTYIP